MALPAYTGRKYFTAGVSNPYSESLLSSYAWAIAQRSPFSALRSVATGDPLWSGYILYTGDTDTFRYRYNQQSGGIGATTIEVDGTLVHTNTVGNGVTTGTVDISGLALTPSTVYLVTVHNTGGNSDPYWLGLSKTINYTAPPTFVDTAVLTDTQLNTLRSGLAELEEAWAMPHTPNVLGRRGDPGPGNGVSLDGDELTVWRGYIHHTHNTLRYRFRCGIGTKEVVVRIYVNSNNVLEYSASTLNSTQSGTVDISGLSLTRGNFYEAEVTLDRTGTSATLSGFCWLYEISQVGTAAATPPPVWEHGGTNVTHTNLNRYSTLINTIHPGAASPTAPLYYEQPALRTDPSGYRYYIQHRRKWLRYRVRTDVTNRTPEIEYGPRLGYTYALDATAGNHSFDLTTIPKGLGVGQYYVIEDAEFACEYDTEQP
jgi:hypothetical protein